MIYRELSDDWQAAGSNEPELGAIIRAVRRRRSMTLSALAAATDLDKAYISRIERGQKAPSLAALLSIAAILNVPVARLLGEVLGEGDLHILRAEDQGDMPATIGGKLLSGTILYLGDKFVGRRREWGGETLIHALAGAIEVILPDRQIILNAGDWLLFDGRTRHRLRGMDGQPASALLVVGRDVD